MNGQQEAAREFVGRWRDRGDEKQDTAAFWLDLLTNVFGIDNAAEVARFEHPVRTIAGRKGFADLWIEPSRLLVEQKSKGIDLAEREARQGRMVTPAEQGRDYANGIPLSQRPRYVVTCNFSEFWFYDLNIDAQCQKPYLKLSLEQLPDNLAAFAMLEGGGEAQTVLTRKVSIEAGRIMGDLYRLATDAYKEAGANPDDPKVHHALAVLMTRLMFLMFCEDAGVVRPNAFKNYLQSHRYEQYQSALQELFAWCDTKEEERNPYEGDELKAFPYMNGGLFRERIFLPPLGEKFAHTLLVNGSQEFNWAGISPTVFGSIFEGALSHDHRRANGQHFTSPENIHRVLDPLFLDDLEREFWEAKEKPVAGGARTKALRTLNDKIGTIVVLDPAAGSGNFLTEAYLSLRRLENRIFIEAQRDADTWQSYIPGLDDDAGHNLDVTISLSNFHGIEKEDYACCVARTALWIADIQANFATQQITGRPYRALPLRDYEGIVCANALSIDWEDVVPASEVSYVLGNPPFKGARGQSPEQKSGVIAAFGNARGSGNNDLVSAWFKKASDYTRSGSGRIAFVATNSICQGEQATSVWKPILDDGCTIDFAWPTFPWDSEADDKAHVHVVIVGYSHGEPSASRRFLSKEDGKTVARPAANINAYLADAPDVFAERRSRPISAVPDMGIGNKPIDGGYYLFTDEEKAAFLAKEPNAERFFHPWVGSREFINGYTRNVLWLGEATPKDLLSLPLCRERVEAVRKYRLSSKSAPTRRLAETPTRFHVECLPTGPSVVVPKVSSERRKYVPMGFVGPSTFCSDLVFMVPGATLYHYGIMQSLFHAAWMRTVAGRLESRYRYSAGVVYNTFVWPAPTDSQRTEVKQCAQAVLDAREEYGDCSLAQMYDPDNAWMFPRLINAHDALDAAVEAAYGIDFGGDEEQIVSHLFGLLAEAERRQGRS